MDRACVDLSAVAALLLPTQRTTSADALWNVAARGDLLLMAPPLLFVELASLLRLRVVRGDLSLAEGNTLYQHALELGIQERNPPALKAVAWELSRSLGLQRTADAYYMALAEVEGSPLWTANRRLYNRMHSVFDKLNFLE